MKPQPIRSTVLALALALLTATAPVAPAQAAPIEAAPADAAPQEAAPAEQSPDVAVTPARLQVYPLGTARVQMVLTNPTASEQVFALEILLVRADGSIATAYLSDALSLGPGITATAIYTIRHADGAVEAVVTPRRWPNLSS
ncbi:MAG: hypothetical protein IT306_19425 [Chloroflexi bacterium]|nr:hypothetical protein [Chloroflexota bacterium]